MDCCIWLSSRIELFSLTELIEDVSFCEEQMCVASEKLNIPAENKEILIFFCLALLSAVDEAATVK